MRVMISGGRALTPIWNRICWRKSPRSIRSGQYPNTLTPVLSALQSQDKDAATKLTAKVVSKLQSENMLANVQAETLALSLLRAGAITPSSAQAVANQAAADQTNSNSGMASQASSIAPPVLVEVAYKDLMNTVIDAALRAVRQPPTSQGGQGSGRGRGNFGAAQNPNQSPLTDGQIEQQNARRLLAGLQMLLPQIDQYLPSRGT